MATHSAVMLKDPGSSPGGNQYMPQKSPVFPYSFHCSVYLCSDVSILYFETEKATSISVV